MNIFHLEELVAQDTEDTMVSWVTNNSVIPRVFCSKESMITSHSMQPSHHLLRSNKRI